MACVTLKRPLDLDPFEALHSPNRPQSKRRRCTPIKGLERDSTYTPPPPPSVFRESALSPAEIANQLRDELKRMRRRRQIVADDMTTSRHSPSPPMLASPYSPSEFVMDSMSDAPISVAALQRRHLLQQHQQQPATSLEKPVFTLKQMTLICERMCKERTDQVREEYDRILQQKLSEQYDAFVKFIDHQIQQRFNESQLPSYLS